MRKGLNFLLALSLHLHLPSCVAYPARHVSEPSYQVYVSGATFESIHLISSIEADDGTCDGGQELKLSSGHFYSEPEYGWLKLLFLLPIDAFKPIKICAVQKDGSSYYWSGNIGVLPNHHPEVWKFYCELSDSTFICEKRNSEAP